MTQYIKTNDPRVLEMLKSIGAPDNCTGVNIDFQAGGLVTVKFEKVLSSGEYETVEAYLADKSAITQD